MLRIRTFGGLFIEGDGLSEGGATQQRRPLAVLALLAAAGNAGVSRDRIAGLLWPESDSDRAFNTLRQWIFQLRRDLKAPDAITGTAELRLNPTIITSDIAEFRVALEHGELERAMGLYRGPFLDGFHLPNAPEFERWQREVAHETTVESARALQRLATDSGQRGDHEVAIGWWRRLAALDPLNVRAAIGLMNALAAAGDIAAAIKHAHLHASLMQLELGIAPDASVIAAANQLRVAAEARAGSIAELPELISSQASEATPTIAAPSLEEEHLDRTHGEQVQDADSVVAAHDSEARVDEVPARKWNRARFVVGASLAGLVATATIGRSLLGHGSPLDSRRTTRKSEDVIAVLPFDVAPNRGLDFLRDGIVSLLSADMDGAGSLRAVSPQAILSAEVAKDSIRSAKTNAALAQRFGAGRFIVGNIVRVGHSIQVNAAVYGAEHPDSVLAGVSVAGDSSRVLDLSKELAKKLLAALHPSPGDRLIRNAASVTSSLEAYRHYLDGEALFRRGEYAAASNAFREAVSVDTTFALAYYRLSLSADWAGGVELMQWAANRATQLSARLSMHDRDMLSGLIAWHEGRADDAEHYYRQVLDSYPDDVDAWYQLGEVQFHLSPLFGHSLLEARDAFASAIHFRPDNREAVVHLLRLAAKAHDSTQVDTLTRHLITSWPTGDTIGVLAFRAFTIGSDSEQGRMLSALSGVSDEGLLQVALKVALYSENFRGAERIARLLTDDVRAAVYQRWGYLYLGFLAMAEGRRAAAESSLVAAERPLRLASGGTEVTTKGLRAFLYALPDVPATHEELDEALSLAASWRSPARDDLVMELLDSRFAPFVEGLLDTRLENSAAADDAARRLLLVRGQNPVVPLAHEMMTTTRGLVAIARRTQPDALALLEGSLCPLDPGRAGEVLGTRMIRRYTRAVLLDSLGQTDEALRWFRSIGGVGIAELMLLAPAHLRQARLFERLGNRGAARDHYRRFIELWRDADPEFQPLLRDAERELKSLEAPR